VLVVGNSCPTGKAKVGGPAIKFNGRLVGGFIQAGKGVGPSLTASFGLSTNSNPFSPSSCAVGFNMFQQRVDSTLFMGYLSTKPEVQ
jgi:hypothetical protein